MLIEILIFSIITSLFVLKWHLEHHFSQFRRLGIPGPKPSVFFGNLRELRGKGQFQALKEWAGQFGRIFGYFEGYTPVMVVGDPEILKQVLVKDSANFMKRKMVTIMSESADILVERLQDKVKEANSMDIYSVFQCLTLDVIGRCAFGLRTRAQVDENDLFLVKIRRLFHTMTTTIIQPIVMAFPFMSHFIFALKNLTFLFGMNPVVWLRDSLREVIRMRKALGPNANIIDLVQLMLFPVRTENDKCTHVTQAFTEREIVAQSMTFLLAGYETTSASLAFFCYEMARNPDIQKNLHNEISTNIGKQDVNYESIQKLEYLDWVFDEVCRLYPTASFIVTRQATESRQYGDVTIPAKMNVLANVWSLHRDALYWDQPEVFNPDRFSVNSSSRRASFTFLPFGAGPRHCIGMRFAQLEMKITLVKIIQNFNLTKSEDTEDELELVSRGAIVPKDNVTIKVTRRVTAGRRRLVRHS